MVEQKKSGKFQLMGLEYTIFPLRTLPTRSIMAVFYAGRDFIRYIKRIFQKINCELRIWYYRTIRPLIIYLFRNQHRIVFISDRPKVREAKIGFALSRVGWEVILLYKFLPNYDLDQYFASHHKYINFEHSFRLARKYKTALYHVFTDASDYTTAYNYCLYKPRYVIVDFIDTIVGILSDGYLNRETWRKNLIPQEKFIIENADGFCCRDLQIQVTSREGGYQRKKRTILFPEYCWDPDQLKLSPRISASDDSIHVVLIGHFGIEKAGCYDTGYLDIIRPMLEQKIHFHIYPHQDYYDVYYKDRFDEILEDYINLEKGNPYFHIHTPVRVESITEEISRYDFGIHVVRAHLFDEELRDYKITARKVGGSSRIADYLEAGLPIISQSGQYYFQYLTRFGIMLNLTNKNLNSIKPELAAMKSAATHNQVQEVREKMSIGNQVERLITFYQSMINN